MPPPVLPQADVTGILGPFSVGFNLNLVFFGILLHLFLVYYQSDLYARDPKVTKVVMWSTLLLCAVDAVLCMYGNWYYVVSEASDLATLRTGTYPNAIQPMLTGLTAFIVQGFLIKRAAQLIFNRLFRTIFVSLMGALAAVAFVTSILSTVVIISYVQRKPSVLKIEVVGSIWLYASAIVDVSISVALFVSLKSHVAGFNTKTDSILVKLIRLGLRTAAFTAIPAAAGAILTFIVYRNVETTDIPIAFWLTLSPLYGISIFTTLRARGELRETNLAPNPISLNVPITTSVRGVTPEPGSLDRSERLSKAFSEASVAQPV